MLVYSFRTFPQADKLPGGCFMFSKLNKDFEKLKYLIEEQMPKYIIGIAATKNASHIEPITINKFNNGQVIRGGIEFYRLFVPDNNPFVVSSSSTSSFCNWTMYKVQSLIETNELKCKLMFFHVNIEDLPILNNYLRTLG